MNPYRKEGRRAVQPPPQSSFLPDRATGEHLDQLAAIWNITRYPCPDCAYFRCSLGETDAELRSRINLALSMPALVLVA